jgi:hypothetical protein
MRLPVSWLLSLLLFAGSTASCKSPAKSSDAGQPSDAEPCVENACGGCVVLAGELGASCGDDVGSDVRCGEWACENEDRVHCNRNGCPCGEAAECDDGTVCNGAETCDAVAGCQAGTALSCGDLDVCNGAETCDTVNGCEDGPPLSCDDGNVCNGVETCDLVNGCESGTALVCAGTEVCCSEGCDQVAYVGGSSPSIFVSRDSTQACGIDANTGESIIVTANAFGVPGTQDDNFVPGNFTVSNISIRDQDATERSTSADPLLGTLANCTSSISNGTCDFVLTYDSSGAAIVFLEVSFLVSYNSSEVTIPQFVLIAL